MKNLLEPILVMLVLGTIGVVGDRAVHHKPIAEHIYKLSLPGDINTVRVFPESPDTMIAIRLGDTIYIKFIPNQETDEYSDPATSNEEDTDPELSYKFFRNARFNNQ